MTLRQLLEERKAAIATLQKRIKEIQEEVSAIEKVLTISDLDECEITLPPPITISDSGKDLANVYSGFPQFLSQFLFENGLTRKDFAELVGVTPTSVSNWISGGHVQKQKAGDIARKIQDLSGNSVKAADVMRLIG